MLKQLACAAAISSSGLVALPVSWKARTEDGGAAAEGRLAAAVRQAAPPGCVRVLRRHLLVPPSPLV
jgi:hypothetical protein